MKMKDLENVLVYLENMFKSSLIEVNLAVFVEPLAHKGSCFKKTFHD